MFAITFYTTIYYQSLKWNWKVPKITFVFDILRIMALKRSYILYLPSNFIWKKSDKLVSIRWLYTLGMLFWGRTSNKRLTDKGCSETEKIFLPLRNRKLSSISCSYLSLVQSVLQIKSSNTNSIFEKETRQFLFKQLYFEFVSNDEWWICCKFEI